MPKVFKGGKAGTEVPYGEKMDILSFRKLVRENNYSVDVNRIESAYQDLLNITAVYSEMGSGIDPIHLYEAGRNDEAAKAMWQERCLVTLLKAAYQFSDVFISTLLHEITGWPTDGMTLNKFLTSKQLPITLSLDSVLPAYCAIVYRNKIIVHQDFYRMYWYRRRAGGKLQLEPVPQFIHISKEDAEILQRLREVYMSTIPGLSDENNQFMQLRLLF